MIHSRQSKLVFPQIIHKCKLIHISHSCQYGYILNSAGNLSTFTFDVERELAITHEYLQMSCDKPNNILLF